MGKIQIFELFGSVILKDEGVESKLDNLDNKAKKTGMTFGGLVGGVAKMGAALAVAVGGVALASIKDASEAEASLAQLGAVLKSTGGAAGITQGELTDLADSLEKTTKFSAESTQEAESLLLTFTNIGKNVFPQATKTALDMATALGGEPKDQAIALGKALNDPIKGVTALTRVGVTFSEEQKKSIKAMQEHGDMAGAQKVILAELTKEFGGSAEAAGKTFAGQLAIAKNAMGNVTETLGTALLPKLTEFLNWVTPHLPAIADFFTKAFAIIGEAFSVTGKFITDKLIPVFRAIYDWVVPFIPAIKEVFKLEFEAIKQILKGIGEFVTTYILPTFTAMRDWFVANFPAIKAAVQQAYDYIKPHFDNLVSVIKTNVMPIIMGLLDTVKKAMPGIQAVFQIVMPVVVWLITAVIDGIAALIQVVRGIYNFIKPGLDKVADIFSTVFKGIKKVIDMVQAALNLFNRTPMNDKNSTVTTNRVDNYSSGKMLPSHASGTDFFEGGLTHINEIGGEIVDLPRGSRIIPHDVSMEMAKNSGRNGGATINFYGNYAFSGQDDMDYFMNKSAQLIQRRQG